MVIKLQFPPEFVVPPLGGISAEFRLKAVLRAPFAVLQSRIPAIRRNGVRFASALNTLKGETFSCHLNHRKEVIMPRGDKSKYSEKQKRQAEHIEEGYQSRGVDEPEAEKRAWATVNKMTGGGKRPGGSGRGKPLNKEPAQKGGRSGGRAAASRPAQQRSASARKAAQKRKRNASQHKSQVG